MTLAEFLSTSPSPAEMQGQYIVASKELRDALLAKQATLTTNHHITPVLLTDGRYAARCMMLTATGTGKIFNPIFQLLDQGTLMAAEVVDAETLKALLPVEEGEI